MKRYEQGEVPYLLQPNDPEADPWLMAVFDTPLLVGVVEASADGSIHKPSLQIGCEFSNLVDFYLKEQLFEFYTLVKPA